MGPRCEIKIVKARNDVHTVKLDARMILFRNISTKFKYLKIGGFLLIQIDFTLYWRSGGHR
jgi:hypothetical protein